MKNMVKKMPRSLGRKMYNFKLLIPEARDAEAWCKENLVEGTWSIDYDVLELMLENQIDYVAVKLKFTERETVLMIDPPRGSAYGFPKALTKKSDQTLEAWLVENGYPQSMIDQGMAQHCRLIG